MRSQFRWVLYCLALCFHLAFIGCSAKDSAPGQSDSPGKRPENVHQDAVWVGGADGGVYVLVTKPSSAPSDTYSAHIFHENGESWYQGVLVLRPDASNPLDLENKNQFSGWDGDKLYLSDGRYLTSGEPEK